MKKIIKRDGRVVDYDRTKMVRLLNWASDGIDGIPHDDIIKDVYDSLGTVTNVQHLHSILINVVSQNISLIYPKTTYAASKLYALKISKDHKPASLNETFKANKALYDQDILATFTEDDLNFLDSKIDHKRDYDFTYSGLYSFMSKYSHNGIETPQYTYMRAAMGLLFNVNDRMEKIVKFYNILSNAQVTLGTPLLLNALTVNGALSSCVLNTVGNNTFDIFNKVSTIALQTKAVGGLALDVSQIQGKGTLTNNGAKSGGVVPFIKVMEESIMSMMQSSNRRGSAIITLAWYHMDVMDFLELKDATSGAPEKRALKLKYSLATNDVLYQAAVDNLDVYLFNPQETPELNKTFGKEWAEHYNRYVGMEGIYKRKISARKLFMKFDKFAFNTGNVSEILLDNVNKSNMTKRYVGSSNLCVAPETKILTDKGQVTISDAVGKCRVWNGFEFSDTEVVKTGENQSLITVETSTGKIECTPYHKFYLNDGSKVEAQDLNVGDKLIRFDLPIIEGNKILDNPYDNGFFTADGCYDNNKYTSNKKIYLYGKKKELLPHFTSNIKWITENETRMSFNVEHDELEDKYFIPDASYTIESRVKWLAGLLDGDGCLTTNNGSQSLQIVQTNKKFLYDLRLMLQTLGVESKVSKAMDGGYHKMPANDGSGDSKLYHCKETKRILISSSATQQLLNLGIDCKRHNINKRKINRVSTRFIKVVSVTDNGRTDDTYCFNEPKRNMGMFDGFLIGNCQEIVQPSRPSELIEETYDTDGVVTTKYAGEEIALCNLASVNLMNFNTLTIEENKAIVDLLVEVVDNSIDIGNYVRKSGEYTNKKYRYIGIGVSNYARVLAEHQMKMDTKEAKDMTFRIFDIFSNYVIQASAKLARDKGAFPAISETEWADGKLPYDIANEGLKKQYRHLLNLDDYIETKDMVAKWGVRNALLTAIAPTACILRNTVIKTPNGNKKIEAILEAGGVDLNKIIKDNAVGWHNFDTDVVVDGIDGDETVSRFWYNGEHETIDIEFEDGNTYSFTANHKLLVNRDGEEVWTRVDELNEGDDIVNVGESKQNVK